MTDCPRSTASQDAHIAQLARGLYRADVAALAAFELEDETESLLFDEAWHALYTALELEREND